MRESREERGWRGRSYRSGTLWRFSQIYLRKTHREFLVI